MMEVPDDTADGQHFRCPFCGEKTAYSKPVRIEIPVGADRYVTKSKIGIRHPSATDVARRVELEDRLRMAINLQPPKAPVSAPKGVVTAAEERVKMFEEMRRKEARLKMARNFVESVMLLMALGVVVGLALWWQSHKNKVAAEAARIEAEAEANSMKMQQERDRLAREKREKDRMEREAARAREEELRKREQEELARRQREEREAKERAEREVRDNRERYHLYSLAFKENKFDLFTRAVTNGMDISGGELCYLFPSATSPAPFYHVVYGTGGMRRVSRIEGNGKREDVGSEALDEKIGGLEYLVVKGDKVFFKSLRKTPPDGILNIAVESDPAETFFGALASTLKELKPTYDELTFDIFFTPKGSSKRIFVENLPFGCAWSRQNAREAIEKEVSLGNGGSRIASTSKKRFKRTVKLWEGSQIKRGVDGITYVPRYPPHERVRTTYKSNLPNVIYRNTTQTYYNDTARWQVLYNQAVSEDAKEAAYYERRRQTGERNRAAAQYAADEEWNKKVDKMFRDGTLSYHIRKAKVQD